MFFPSKLKGKINQAFRNFLASGIFYIIIFVISYNFYKYHIWKDTDPSVKKCVKYF